MPDDSFHIPISKAWLKRNAPSVVIVVLFGGWNGFNSYVASHDDKPHDNGSHVEYKDLTELRRQIHRNTQRIQNNEHKIDYCNETLGIYEY